MATFVTIGRDSGETAEINLDLVAYVLRDRKGAARVQFLEEDAFLMLSAAEAKQLPALGARAKNELPATHPVQTTIF